MLVSVIIPAFNEEQTIGPVVEAVRSLPIEKQIIVVNDGSTDGTSKVLEQLREAHQLTVVHCQENRGKGFAIRSGLPYVEGEAVVIQDADMELSPADLSELLKPLEEEDVQVVYGSRFLNGRGNASFRNFIANRVLATYANLLYGCRITDESTGYKAFSTELITRLNLTCEGFEFCPEVTAKILRAGHRIHEVPVSYFPRTKKQGKKLRFWSDGFLAAWTLLKYRFISKTELFENTTQTKLR
jgi:glycosyltransferase involved in cell wall biosynthesis